MQTKRLDSFGILPGGRWEGKICPLLSLTFLMLPSKLSEFLMTSWLSWAMFDVCLLTTRLQILGHGQGMTTYYVMLDQHPELAPKISLTTSMAPITYGAHTTGLLKLCAQFLISLPHWMTVGCCKRTLITFHNSSPSKVHFCLPPVYWIPWQVSFVRKTPAPSLSAMTFSSQYQGKVVAPHFISCKPESGLTRSSRISPPWQSRCSISPLEPPPGLSYTLLRISSREEDLGGKYYIL